MATRSSPVRALYGDAARRLVFRSICRRSSLHAVPQGIAATSAAVQPAYSQAAACASAR